VPLAVGAGSLEPVLRATGFGIADADPGPTVAYLTGCLSPLLADAAPLVKEVGLSLSSAATMTRLGPTIVDVDLP